MNQPNLNDKLDGESSKHKLLYFWGGLTVFCVGLVVVIGLMVVKGTKIEVRPLDAQENAIISVRDGLGLYVSGSVYTLNSSPKIVVSAQGYEVKEQAIPENVIGKIFKVELRELPGKLVVETSPIHVKTSWLIDGKIVAVSPGFGKELYAGHYKLTIDNPYFLPHEEQVTIVREKDTDLKIMLKPVLGEMDIKSNPSHAVVMINGENVGVTPLKFPTRAGDYEINITHPNYRSVTENISLLRGQNFIKRNYKLELKKAYISVAVQPVGGDFLLNGAQISPNGKITVDAIRKNTVSYHKKGYFSATEVFTLKADEERHIQFSLKAERGEVEFSSSPVADVFLNGKNIGTTPLQKQLPALPYKVTFKKEGYRSVTKLFKPSASAKQKISVKLKTELAARLSQSPAQYTNSAGVKLKLFLPKGQSFVMGAARHEKGQRANEFVRNIKLTKPFYAGVYEITNQQYGLFNKQAGSASPQSPATSLSWIQAAKFTNWLSQREKLVPFYNINGKRVSFNAKANGYRLLTEAEWEWLARSMGRKGQTKFTWGDRVVIPPKAANVADESAKGQVQFYVPQYSDGYAKVAPIGSFNKEKSGLYDFAGNVSEWVHDYYSLVPPRNGQIDVDPLGLTKGQIHTIKGANWRSGTLTELRPSFREGMAQGRDDLGFRIGRYVYGGGS